VFWGNHSLFVNYPQVEYRNHLFWYQ
jgi:hypothetical protein